MITFEIDGKIVKAHPNESVWEACERLKMSLDSSCEGHGTCGTCRVYLLAGSTQPPERNEIEQEIAGDRGFTADERLACQIPVQAGLRLRRAQ